MCQHLELRAGRYHLRINVPADLQSIIGKTAIRRTLRTGDKREAKRRAEPLVKEMKAYFADLRANKSQDLDTCLRAFLDRLQREDAERRAKPQPVPDPILLQFPSENVNEVVGREILVEELRANLTNPYYPGADLPEIRGDQERPSPEGMTVPYVLVHDDIARAIQDCGLTLKEDSQEYHDFARRVVQKRIEAEQIAIARAKGDVVAEKQLLDALLPPLPVPIKAPSPQTSPKLSDIFDKWKAEHLGAGGTSKTVGEFWTQVERFIELFGDLPVHEITPAQVRDFKDCMLCYPKLLTNAEKALPIQERLALVADNPSRAVLSPRSVNDKCLGAVAAVLGYATHNQYIKHNPAAGIKVKMAKASNGPKRLPYSTDDLRTIFNFPIYIKGDRPIGGAGEAAFWLPLLAAFTGARLEELGQLLVDDVKQEQGIWFFDMLNLDDQSEENARHFKTKQSRRLVPIHSTLIKIGLLEYVKERRDAGDVRLFPLVTSSNPDSAKTGPFSQWWGRYARKHGGFGPQKVFHSFRHAAKTAFRECGVEEAVYDALQGHAAATEGRKYGQHSLKTLAEAIEKLSYDVELGHLMPHK